MSELIGTGLILLAAVCFLIVRYPSQLKDSLEFKDRESKTEIFFSVLSWIWLLGACATVAYLATKIETLIK